MQGQFSEMTLHCNSDDLSSTYFELDFVYHVPKVPSLPFPRAKDSNFCKDSGQQLPRPSAKTTGKRAFSVAAPFLGNSHPESLRAVSSVKIFEKQLKTYLFRQAYC